MKPQPLGLEYHRRCPGRIMLWENGFICAVRLRQRRGSLLEQGGENECKTLILIEDWDSTFSRSPELLDCWGLHVPCRKVADTSHPTYPILRKVQRGNG